MVGHAGSLDEMIGEGKFAGADVLVVDADILTEANSGVLNGSSEQFLHELRCCSWATDRMNRIYARKTFRRTWRWRPLGLS
jgi:hypothetical protein